MDVHRSACQTAIIPGPSGCCLRHFSNVSFLRIMVKGAVYRVSVVVAMVPRNVAIHCARNRTALWYAEALVLCRHSCDGGAPVCSYIINGPLLVVCSCRIQRPCTASLVKQLASSQVVEDVTPVTHQLTCRCRAGRARPSLPRWRQLRGLKIVGVDWSDSSTNKQAITLSLRSRL